MATLTLKRMVDGGIYDHLGGGFARYSVDERWEVPHFEKMLYDNGALLSALSDATLATGDELFARAARETAEYLLRDCRLPGGAFCSSFDADSEGHEGKFYVWTREQVEAALGQDAALFCAHYGLDAAPNFEGQWHLTAHGDFDALSPEDRRRLDQVARHAAGTAQSARLARARRQGADQLERIGHPRPGRCRPRPGAT